MWKVKDDVLVEMGQDGSNLGAMFLTVNIDFRVDHLAGATGTGSFVDARSMSEIAIFRVIATFRQQTRVLNRARTARHKSNQTSVICTV